jgi:CRP/FNR family transcriptional regulator, cyclic AMP receptor protein
MIPLILENAVANHPFVRGMSPGHVRILTECAMLTHFDPGQMVFRAGEIANRFYLIQRGKVSLENRAEGTEMITIQTLGAGNVLGWSWLFAPYYWHFDARALEPTQAIFFYGTRLRERGDQDHEFGYQLMRRVAAVLIGRLQVALKESLRLAASPAFLSNAES